MQVVFAILGGSRVPVCQLFSPVPGTDRTLSLHHPDTWYYHTAPLTLMDNAEPWPSFVTVLCATRCHQPKLAVRTGPPSSTKLELLTKICSGHSGVTLSYPAC